MNKQRVLISGASIAGLACAYWLDQHGFVVTVVEIAAKPRPGGQAVDLRGAGRTVIERMGLLDEARDISLTQAGMSWVDENGGVCAAMPADAFDGEGFISEIEILRGDLVDLLHQHVEGAVEFLFNDTITDIAQTSNGVEVAFRTSPSRQFDLVVGADGLHSVIRSLAFGAEPEYVTPRSYWMQPTRPPTSRSTRWAKSVCRAGGTVGLL